MSRRIESDIADEVRRIDQSLRNIEAGDRWLARVRDCPHHDLPLVCGVCWWEVRFSNTHHRCESGWKTIDRPVHRTEQGDVECVL